MNWYTCNLLNKRRLFALVSTSDADKRPTDRNSREMGKTTSTMCHIVTKMSPCWRRVSIQIPPSLLKFSLILNHLERSDRWFVELDQREVTTSNAVTK